MQVPVKVMLDDDGSPKASVTENGQAGAERTRRDAPPSA